MQHYRIWNDGAKRSGRVSAAQAEADLFALAEAQAQVEAWGAEQDAAEAALRIAKSTARGAAQRRLAIATRNLEDACDLVADLEARCELEIES